jgi:hypothetical protein
MLRNDRGGLRVGELAAPDDFMFTLTVCGGDFELRGDWSCGASKIISCFWLTQDCLGWVLKKL